MNTKLLSVVAIFLIGCVSNEPEPEPAPATAVRVSRQFLTAGAGLPVQGVLAGKTLYLAGLSASDTSAPIEAQTRAAMEQLGELLAKADLNYSNLVSCHVQLSDMNNYAAMNAVYASFFEEGHYPARTTLEFPALRAGASVLVTCTAYTDDTEIEVVRPSEDVIPAAMGPYSPAVRAGGTVYLSGQGGRDPRTGELSAGTGSQAALTLTTIGHILDAANLGFQNVAFASSYSPPSADPSEIDDAFNSRYSVGGAPSRAVVGLSRLPGDILTEITFIAASDNYITRLFMYDEEPTALVSPASLTGDTLYASAMTGEGEDFAAQFGAAVERHEALLQLGLIGLENVVSVRAYLADLADLEEFERGFDETFPEGPPVVTIVQSNQPEGIELSIEMVAVR